MLVPFAVAFLGLSPQDSGQGTGITNPFAGAVEVAETQRIAVTPTIDGKFNPEEWDPFTFSPRGSTFMQWEPGKVHVGALVPAGSTVVLSLDLKNNGWLVGDDNVEVILKVDAAGTVTASGRMLDGRNPNGPAWIEVPGFAVSTVAKSGPLDGKVLIEATITDPGIGVMVEEARTKIGARIDILETTATRFEPFFPRPVAPVDLVMARGAGLPSKLVFRPENVGKSVVPGQTVKLRFAFEGNNSLGLKRLAMRSEGEAKDYTNVLESPFPSFDNKGRAFLDYETAVALGANQGYRLVRGALKLADDVEALTQVSYRVAPDVDVDMVLQRRMVDTRDRSYKEGFYIRSNNGRQVEGRVKVTVPEPLRILNGGEKVYRLNSRTRTREGFEIYVPANTVGTFPVRFEITSGGSTTVQTGFVTIR